MIPQLQHRRLTTHTTGDSLPVPYNRTALERVVKDVCEVTLHLLGQKMKDGGNTLAHGTQNDTHSCGICTVNAVDHALFQTELFVHRQCRYWRALYFNRLVQAENERVRVRWLTRRIYLRWDRSHARSGRPHHRHPILMYRCLVEV